MKPRLLVCLFILSTLFTKVILAQQTPVGISNVKIGYSANGLDTIIPLKPINLDSIPPSEMDIPVTIALQPIYKMVEQKIPKEYTSKNYPNDWVMEGCDTRYMYKFIRGPFRFRTQNNVLFLEFTGFYQVKGSQRYCTDGGTALSPWAPACSCGYDKEGQKKVEIGFKIVLNVNPDYSIAAQIERLEPLATDKCEVCIFKKDITQTVLTALKLQLDDSKKNMELQIKQMNMRKDFQKVWDQLSKSWKMSSAGWLKINPTALRLSQLNAWKDTLRLTLGLTAKPVVMSAMPKDIPAVLPNLSLTTNKPGFSIYMDAQLEYDSLGATITEQLKGKSFEFMVKKTKKIIVIHKCELKTDETGQLIVMLDFDGSHKGILYLKGKPEFDAQTNVLTIKDLDFDIKKNFLLNTIEWLFNKKILKEMRQYSSIPMQPYLDSMKTMLSTQLNREVAKGIFTKGQMKEVKILQLKNLATAIELRCSISGDLDVLVSEIGF